MSSQRFKRVAEILGVQKHLTQVDGLFTEDAEASRRSEAAARKAEFEHFASSPSGQTVEQRMSDSSRSVKRDYRHLVQPDGAGGFSSIAKDMMRAVDMSGKAIRRSDAATDRVEAPTDISMFTMQPHLFQTRESYEAMFDGLAEAAQRRKADVAKQRSSDANRRQMWEDTQKSNLQEVISKANGEFDPRSMFGGTSRLSGIEEAASSNFGILKIDEVDKRVAAKQKSKDARQARRDAISRTIERPSVNDQIAEALPSMGKSVQAQSADSGLVARLSSMFDPAQ